MTGSSSTIGLVQVGFGGWGRDWATRVLPRVPGVQLRAVVDLHHGARDAAVTLGLVEAKQCFASLEEALSGVDGDAVLVTADLPAHIPAVTAALEHGCHVLVEKPFAPSLAEALAAVELAEKRRLVLMVSQNYRFYPAVRAVQEQLGRGELGELLHVEIDFRRFSAPRADGTHGHRLWREPLLLDMSIHHFDLLRAVTGREPLAVDCRTRNPSWAGFADPPEGVAAVELAAGVLASYRGSWLAPDRPTAWAGEWRMELEHGELWWTSRADQGAERAEAVWRYDHQGRRHRVALPALQRHDRAGALEAFVAALASGCEPESSGRDNLGSLALTYAAIESARRHERVALVDLQQARRLSCPGPSSSGR